MKKPCAHTTCLLTELGTTFQIFRVQTNSSILSNYLIVWLVSFLFCTFRTGNVLQLPVLQISLSHIYFPPRWEPVTWIWIILHIPPSIHTLTYRTKIQLTQSQVKIFQHARLNFLFFCDKSYFFVLKRLANPSDHRRFVVKGRQGFFLNMIWQGFCINF